MGRQEFAIQALWGGEINRAEQFENGDFILLVQSHWS